MHPGTHRLSIDLGTATTVAVLAVPGAPARVVEVDGAPAMPSAVFATEDGRLVVGREAEQLAPTMPARFEPSPRSRIDEGTLLLGDAVVPVATALGALLGKVVAAAAHQLGGVLPAEILLTHPARWDSTRCGVLRAAAQQAGLGPRVQLVPAPVAAAAHFAAVTGRPLRPGQSLVVGDLGAGTFDVTVVAAGPVGVTMLAEAELSGLGGRDVDQALFTHLGGQVAERDPDGWQRLLNPRTAEDWSAAKPVWDSVRQAKETLSGQPSAEVALPAPFGTVPVTRDELHGLLEPAVRRGAELLVTTAQRAGVGATPPACVYLVGGSSRLPLVARLVAERTGMVPVVPDQPETAVAFGACLLQHGDLDAPTQRLPPVAAPPPGPASGRRMGRAAIVGTLSAVVVAAIVAVIVLAPWRSGTESSSEPSQAGPNGKGGFHWSLTLGDLDWTFVGLWQADTSVVLGTAKALTAYDVESGRELWSWEPPENNYICTMSPATAVGRGAITYGPMPADGGDECHHLQTISVESGEPGWEEPVSLVAEGFTGEIGKLGGASLSISDSLVTAPYAGRDSDPEFTTDLTWVDTQTGERLGSTDTEDTPVCWLTG